MPFESEAFRKEFDKHILNRGSDEIGTTIPQGLSHDELRDFMFNLQKQARIKLGLEEEKED